MKKVAIFVEGHTEAIFVDWLIRKASPAGSKIAVSKGSMEGKKHQRILPAIRIYAANDSPTHYIQIINSQNDDMVKSDIIEHHSSLLAAGFSEVIGLRDLFPLDISELPKIEKYLSVGLPSSIQTQIHIAVKEIEAWFIAEHTHFARFSSLLSVDKIKRKLGHDLSSVDVEAIHHPAAFLDSIYRLGLRRYRKKQSQVRTILTKFDYLHLRQDIAPTIPRLDQFLSHIEVVVS